jgi:hypothetical protein
VTTRVPPRFQFERVAVLSLAALLAMAAPGPAHAQISLSPTPSPIAVADDEPWFQTREAILFGGTLYFPAGARVYFNRNEMVPTGSHGTVMLYVRTTYEPNSVIFVPLSGGLMQPYERRRAGDLAGTVGSTTPSFPVESTAEAASAGTAGLARAGGPPTSVGSRTPAVVSALGTGPEPAAQPTSGTVAPTAARTPSPPGRNRSLSAAKPEGLNGIFVTFGGERWFSNGPAIALDTARLTRVGQIGETAVYRDPANSAAIYVASSGSSGTLVAPFARR